MYDVNATVAFFENNKMLLEFELRVIFHFVLLANCVVVCTQLLGIQCRLMYPLTALNYLLCPCSKPYKLVTR